MEACIFFKKKKKRWFESIQQEKAWQLQKIGGEVKSLNQTL